MLRIKPGAAGFEGRTLSIVLCPLPGEGNLYINIKDLVLLFYKKRKPKDKVFFGIDVVFASEPISFSRLKM